MSETTHDFGDGRGPVRWWSRWDIEALDYDGINGWQIKATHRRTGATGSATHPNLERAVLHAKKNCRETRPSRRDERRARRRYGWDPEP